MPRSEAPAFALRGAPCLQRLEPSLTPSNRETSGFFEDEDDDEHEGRDLISEFRLSRRDIFNGEDNEILVFDQFRGSSRIQEHFSSADIGNILPNFDVSHR